MIEETTEEQDDQHVTKILNGKGIAAQIRSDLKRKIAQTGLQPGLAVVLVGQDPASEIYVKFKAQASEEVGMYLETIELEEDVSQKKLLKIIDKLNKNKQIHGILVQLPLPKHLNPLVVSETIDPAKDVDGFHPDNMGWLMLGKPYLVPATSKGIWTLVKSTRVKVKGRHVVMVGASNIVGKPTAAMFLNEGATVSICHKLTKNLEEYTRLADILITATGVPHLISADMVSEGVMVIDAGISRVEGKVVGDVKFDEVAEKAGYITPVPGGVGPMTVASLLQNTWTAARAIEGLDAESEG